MDERADYEEQASREAYYHFVLMEFAQLVREFGAKQVQHDLNQYYEEDTCHIRIDPVNTYIVTHKKRAA